VALNLATRVAISSRSAASAFCCSVMPVPLIRVLRPWWSRMGRECGD
jgi:hypothetical protein